MFTLVQVLWPVFRFVLQHRSFSSAESQEWVVPQWVRYGAPGFSLTGCPEAGARIRLGPIELHTIYGQRWEITLQDQTGLVPPHDRQPMSPVQ